jgi:RNA polymerase sigma-70 factor (ECF subfamily)
MVTATTTAELLERSVAGDRIAFERLFRPLYDDAFRLAAAMLSDASLAEDAVQEALLKAWRKLYTFRTGEDVRPWFLTIVANQCRSVRRTRWWSVQRVAEVDAPSRPDPGTADRLDLEAALARLPRRARLLLVLRYYLDMSFEDIGAMVGASPSAVKSSTHRALVKLRTEWGPVDPPRKIRTPSPRFPGDPGEVTD